MFLLDVKCKHNMFYNLRTDTKEERTILATQFMVSYCQPKSNLSPIVARLRRLSHGTKNSGGESGRNWRQDYRDSDY